MRWFAVLLLGGLWPWGPAAAGSHDILKLLERRADVKLCGIQLSNALSIVCQGNYNELQPQSSMMTQAPLLSRRGARNILGGARSHRKRRGVYNECCEKSCTYNELATYCGFRVSTH